MNRVSALVLPLLAAVVLATIMVSSAGCARKPDDATISSEIQSKFSQDSGLSSKQLTAQASNGIVTLAGYVDNDAQRAAAARQAGSVEGVKEVINNLQVGNAPVLSSKAVAAKTPLRAQPQAVKAASGKGARDTAAQTDSGKGDSSKTGSETYAENSQAPPPPPDFAPTNVTPAPPPAPPAPLKVTIEQGTPVSIRLIDSIDSEKNQVGDRFHASLNTALSAEGSVAIAQGTDVTGHIVDLKSASKFKGQSVIVLQLDNISANGASYDVQSDQYRKEGASRGKSTAEKVGGGAIIGGIIGAIAGGGKGAAIGSAAGAGVGGGAQAASKSQAIKLPSETVLNFTLQAPLTVVRPPDPNAGRQKLVDSK